MGYSVLFDSVLDGTLFGKWPHTGIWTCLLSQADRYGVIDKHPNLLAAKIGVPVEQLLACIHDFMQPDPGSRTKEADGRRLELVDPGVRDWGWRVINHGAYRERARLQGKDAARTASGQDAERKRQERASPDVPRCPPDSPSQTPDSKQQTTDVEKKVPAEPVARGRDLSPAERVFNHWQTEHGHPKAKLDDKRKAIIRRALKNYSEADLCEAICGYKNSPHHMGQNDRNTVYDDIELFLRDSKHIDAGIKLARAPPGTASAVTQHNVRALQEWVNGSGGQSDIRDDDGKPGGNLLPKDHPAAH